MSMYSGSLETAMESGKDPALPSSEFGGWPPSIPAAHLEYLQPAQNHPLAWAVFLGQCCASAQAPINCWPAHNLTRHTSFHCPRLCTTASRYRAVVQPSVLYLHCSTCTVACRKSSTVWPVETFPFQCCCRFPFVPFSRNLVSGTRYLQSILHFIKMPLFYFMIRCETGF